MTLHEFGFLMIGLGMGLILCSVWMMAVTKWVISPKLKQPTARVEDVFQRANGTYHTDKEEYQREMKAQSIPVADFSVTGKSRTVPWHIRRKELEAAARSRRQKLESFQEFV